MPQLERTTRAGQKRLLAIDGGGIRGVLALAILRRIEEILKKQSGLGDQFRLSDYFDYISGPSTGDIMRAMAPSPIASPRSLAPIYGKLVTGESSGLPR